jgi:hypothetical protein
VLISAVTPSVLQTEANPAGVPQAALEGLQAQLAANRSEFYRAVPSGPFYNFDQPGAEPSEAIIANWWRQGMMGGAKGQYECVFAFIREDYTRDLEKTTVPVLVMHGDAGQVVPYATAAPRAIELLRNGTLKKYRASRTACRPPMPRRSTLTCWPSSSPDHSGGQRRTGPARASLEGGRSRPGTEHRHPAMRALLALAVLLRTKPS